MTHDGFDHAIGFGFDAKSNDYKVVRIVYLIDDRDVVVPPEIDVYSAMWVFGIGFATGHHMFF